MMEVHWKTAPFARLLGVHIGNIVLKHYNLIKHIAQAPF